MVKNFVRDYTNFITPPDFIERKDQHSVLLVDVDDGEIKDIATLCKNVDCSYDIYLYHEGLNDTEWLNRVANMVDHIIVNTNTNELSSIKDKLVTKPNASYYGPKTPLGNINRLDSPLIYFIKLLND